MGQPKHDRSYVHTLQAGVSIQHARLAASHNARLFAIEDIRDSRSFDDARQKGQGHGHSRVLYEEASMFVSCLIDTFVIDKMKQIVCSVEHNAPRDTILQKFEEVFGITVRDAEQAWLAYWDSSM